MQGVGRGYLPLPNPTSVGQPREERLRAACEDFEGIVLGLMVQAMQATVRRGGLIPTRTAGEIFSSLWGQALAREGGARGALGVADMLMKALKPEAHSTDMRIWGTPGPPGRSPRGGQWTKAG